MNKILTNFIPIYLLKRDYYINFFKVFFKKTKENIDLFFLAFAIALSPSFITGVLNGGKTVELRGEDFIIFFLAIWVIILFKKGKIKVSEIKETPFFTFICAWLIVGLITMIYNQILGNYNIIRGTFYFLKEIEFFFIYFYVYWRIKNEDTAKFIIYLWILLMVFNIGYVVFQIVGHMHRGEYCLAAISEEGVFPTGSFFLIAFIFLFNFFIYYILNLKIKTAVKLLLGFAVAIIVFGIFGSGSKTNTVALFFSLFLTVVLFYSKIKNKKLFFNVFLFCLLIVSIFFAFITNLQCSRRINIVFSPQQLTDSYVKARWVVIGPQINSIARDSVVNNVLGFGKGRGEAHNQYLRNFIETGIAGSIVFLMFMFTIIKKAAINFWKEKRLISVGLSAGLLISTLIMLFMGFATEPFLVVKPAEVFWFFAAITMAVLSIEKKQQKYESGNNNSSL